MVSSALLVAGMRQSKSGITLMIGPDGRIDTPYTGIVKLSGLTLNGSNSIAQSEVLQIRP